MVTGKWAQCLEKSVEGQEPQKVAVAEEAVSLARELKLPLQEKVHELAQLGYRCIRRVDMRRILNLKEEVHLTAYTVDKFTGEMSYGALCRLKEAQESKQFGGIFVIAESDDSSVRSSGDPLLIGEIEGRGLLGFWEREPQIFLIHQWE